MATGIVQSNAGLIESSRTRPMRRPQAQRAAADALFFLHTSPILTANAAGQSLEDMPLMSLNTTSNVSSHQQSSKSGRLRVACSGNLKEQQYRDAAGTLCALMATRHGKGATNELCRSRAASLMSLDDEDDTDPFDSMDDSRSDVGPRVGAYSPETRRRVINRFLDKRRSRIWKKRIKYDVRKNFADSRLRVKGRFVRKEDEEQLKDFLSMTA